MYSVELFAGAGGLAMGVANAGFQHLAVIERNHDACNTLRDNDALSEWSIHETDSRLFEYSSIKSPITLVSGGPPCQPFSLGGKHKAFNDNRDMFPEALRAIRELNPKAFILENVKGLLRASFADYFSYIYLQLQYPSLVRKNSEDWREHRSRLEEHHTSFNKPEYKVVFELLNAANYGIPQKRERVFFVGYRSDINAAWSFPKGDYSEEALINEKWVSKKYWEINEVPLNERSLPSFRMVPAIERIKKYGVDGKKPWQTVRSAFRGLPEPESISVNNRISNHYYISGARQYPGHTGSFLDEPAKTLKAGDHGVPGGENMLLKPDGTVRYFSIREAARLQTFPDDYMFQGSWSESMRQLGNAVPVKLAEVVAKSVYSTLNERAGDV